MSDILLDVNIVVDVLAGRTPHADAVRAVLKAARRSGRRVWLYIGSVQTILYVTAIELGRGTATVSTLSERLDSARRLLSRFSLETLWLAALSEDGDVLGGGDPEDNQLINAVARLGAEATLLTRDSELARRCTQAVHLADFVARHSSDRPQDATQVTPPAFVDLRRQLDALRAEMEREIWRVVDSTAFINGPAVAELEAELAEHTGVKHAIGCSNGTDALILGMMALNIRRGDEVIVPDFSFIATAETVALMAAAPVFVDVRPDTCNIEPDAVRAAITGRTVGIIPVSLYGQVAEMDEINAIAADHGLWVMEDGAQSYGATYRGTRSCALSRIGATSFFPSKPLGCYGDGGALFTDDDDLASRMRMILNHGQRKRYDHALIGFNGRLDTLQAAILQVKLKHFGRELERRQQIADWYNAAFAGRDDIITPTILGHNRSTWAQYTVRIADRPRVQDALRRKGIPTAVHYPIPLHKQDAFAGHAQHNVAVPNTDLLSAEVLSLPMHPYLTKAEVQFVAQAVVESVYG